MGSLEGSPRDRPHPCAAAQCRSGMWPEEQGTAAELQLQAVAGGQDPPWQGAPAKGTSQH